MQIAHLDFSAEFPKDGGSVRCVRQSTPVLFGTLVALVVGAHPERAHAQGNNRTVAAAAYDQGTRAFAAGDFNAAAEFFETANRSVPSAQAMIQAIRAHRGAEAVAHDARAATLALELLSTYPSDTRVTGYAYRVIDDLSPRLARVQVRCQGCDLSVDEQAAPHSAFFPPGTHAVVASWGARVVRREVTLSPGQTLPLEFEPPLTPLVVPPVEPPPATPVPAAASESAAPGPLAPTREVDAPPRARGLSPSVFAVSLVFTAGVGGALAWSAIDTLRGRDEYVQDPTQARLDDGRGRELRTNILAGATAAMALTTILVAGFTRWRSAPTRPVAALSSQGGLLGLEGAF